MNNRRGRAVSARWAVVALFLAAPGGAATFCVGTAAELHAALLAAETNGEDDFVRVRNGHYVGNFFYLANEVKSLQIVGGYVLLFGGCVRISDDPATTALEPPGAGEVLALTLSGSATAAVTPLLRVSLLTVQNGTRGLRLTNALDDQAVNFEVSRNRIVGATDGGLLMNVIDGNVRIDNNLFTGISSDNPGVALELSMPHVNSGSALYVTHNTIVDNQVLDAGSSHVSLVGAAGNEATFANNIIRDNGWVDLFLDPDVETTVYNNDFELLVGTPDFESGNVDLPASFVDAAALDFRLAYGSLVRNLGHVAPPGGLPTVDIVGKPRNQPPLPDLGAWEVPWIFASGFEAGFSGWSSVVN